MTFFVPDSLCHDAVGFLEKNPEVGKYLSLEVKPTTSEQARLVDANNKAVATGCKQCFSYLKATKKRLAEPCQLTAVIG